MVKCIIAVEQEPRIQFTIEADPDNMPQIIILKDGQSLALSGRYTSKGNNYRYNRITEIYNYAGDVKGYPRYSQLIG